MTGNIILLYKTGLFVNPTVIDDPIKSLIMIDKTHALSSKKVTISV